MESTDQAVQGVRQPPFVAREDEGQQFPELGQQSLLEGGVVLRRDPLFVPILVEFPEDRAEDEGCQVGFGQEPLRAE